MPRYVITARKPHLPMVEYVGRSGVPTFDAARAYVADSLTEALAEREYRAGLNTGHVWAVEQLPPRKPVKTAVLSAVPIDHTATRS